MPLAVVVSTRTGLNWTGLDLRGKTNFIILGVQKNLWPRNTANVKRSPCLCLMLLIISSENAAAITKIASGGLRSNISGQKPLDASLGSFGSA